MLVQGHLNQGHLNTRAAHMQLGIIRGLRRIDEASSDVPDHLGTGDEVHGSTVLLQYDQVVSSQAAKEPGVLSVAHRAAYPRGSIARSHD